MPIKNKSVGMPSDSSRKYCIECGARMPKLVRTCPACGETQVMNMKYTSHTFFMFICHFNPNVTIYEHSSTILAGLLNYTFGRV